MNILVYLLPLALGLGLTGLFAFLWSLKHGQYDDLEGAPLRALSDDDLEHVPEKWEPVFRKGNAQMHESRAHADASQSECALGPPSD